MSTDLYGIRVMEVAPDELRVRLRVFVVYYDTGYEYHQPIPSDRSFFVRVLCDVEALGDDIADDDRFDEAYIDRNSFRYVDRFVELERRNSPLESYDGYSDFYYERDGGWQDEEKLVQADFDVFVSKAEYLEPFSVGQSWGSTSYETESDDLSADEYLDTPDFTVPKTFTPFPDAETEASTANRMSFSADGKQLLVSNDDGGFRVFSTDDWSVQFEVATAGGWSFGAGWTSDGRVAGSIEDAFVAFDIKSGERAPFEPFGRSANSLGTRFVRSGESEVAQVLNEAGGVLFEFPQPFDTMVYVAFDASGQRCALAIEGEELRLVELSSGEVANLGHEGLNSVAMSPDGRFVVASNYQAVLVLRTETGEVIRQLPTSPRYCTAVAWSPDGRLVATSATNEMGYHSKVSVHRLGRDVLAAENEPRRVPERRSADITDVGRLYLERTDAFSSGWNSHLDDDLIDFHLALCRLDLDLDLVANMREEQTRIAARAYEAVITPGGGALGDAIGRLERYEVPEWGQTFLYAPIAAAQFVAGQADEAEASLQLARGKLEDESNAFQKRAVFARTLIVMGRLDEVRQIIEAEDGGWISQFHLRLFTDLIDAGEFDLLKTAFEAWGAADEWDARALVPKRLLENGEFERATSLEWLGAEGAHRDTVQAWQQWFSADPDVAKVAFDAARTARPDDESLAEVMCHRQPKLAHRHKELADSYQARSGWVAALLRSSHENMARDAWSGLDDDEKLEVARHLQRAGETELLARLDVRELGAGARMEWLGLQGHWEQAYDAVNETKKTLRAGLYDHIASAATVRGDVDILLDALSQMTCSEMNSPGLRALQRAFKELAGQHYREFHP